MGATAVKQVAKCCSRGARLSHWGFEGFKRGCCPACVRKMAMPRKEHTLTSAMMYAEERTEENRVGALRLVAWAMRRCSPSDFRFEQGAGACAALLCAR